MPLFLIPLALSLFSVGSSLLSQNQENNRLEAEGQQAVSEQLAKNEAALVNQYSNYVSAIDIANDKLSMLNAQTDAALAQSKRLASTLLYITAGLMALLTVYLLVRRNR